jgi:hypothetical protein
MGLTGRLRVTKLRGQTFRGGYHDFTIVTGGLRVFPLVVAAEHVGQRHQAMLRGELKELDSLLGGGIEVGTSVLLIGPAGSGKSSVAASYARSSALAGKRAAMFASMCELKPRSIAPTAWECRSLRSLRGLCRFDLLVGKPMQDMSPVGRIELESTQEGRINAPRTTKERPRLRQPRARKTRQCSSSKPRE